MTGSRSELIAKLLPGGIPTLWCPPLTHFGADGRIDEERMRKHLRYLSPWVSSFLLPGTTGEGWELSDEESAQLLRFGLEEAVELDLRILVGILKPTGSEMVAAIERFLRSVGLDAGSRNIIGELRERRVAGFTICPPAGEGLGQDEIAAGLRQVLALGLPTALYQLPQITRNEIDPQTAAALAGEFENLFLVKDSSGGDRLATSGRLPDDLFLTRGAEGGYLRWHRDGGGPYDGFLLSTANCFARELATILDPAQPLARRRELSATVTAIIEEAFDAVKGVRAGNAFTNANKAIDHVNAHGPAAAAVAPPRLHGGGLLPAAVIERTASILDRHGLLPEKGYLGPATRKAG